MVAALAVDQQGGGPFTRRRQAIPVEPPSNRSSFSAMGEV